MNRNQAPLKTTHGQNFLRSLGMVLLGAILVALSSTVPAHALEKGREIIRLSGSTTLSDLLILPHKEKIEQRANVQLEIFPIGSVRGLVDIHDGDAEIAMVSADPQTLITTVSQRVPHLLSDTDWRMWRVTQQQVIFVGHPKLAGLSLDESALSYIFSGVVRNWQDFGGPDLAIHPVIESKGGAMRYQVELDVLDGMAFPNDVGDAAYVAYQIPPMIAQTPGAVGFISTGHSFDDELVRVSDVRLTQSLYLVSNGPPIPAARRVIDAVVQLGRRMTLMSLD